MNWSPALGFTHIDENLARCVAPLSKANAQYCVSIQVERILNYSQQPLDPQVLAIFEEHGIRIQEVNINHEEVTASNIAKFQEWIVLCVEDVISQCSHASTLIVGSATNYLDSVVLACFRKVQDWAIVPIISEFRMFTLPHKLHDYEQMIELFDASLVDVNSLSPEWYTIHSNIKAEEIKLKQRRIEHRQKDNTENLDDEDLEQRRIDDILYQLFFDDRNQLITDKVSFNPAVSLVADKDDDD